MIDNAPRVSNASIWAATLAYAYLTFIASTRLVTTATRWAAALLGAGVAYVLVMLAIAIFWQHDRAHAAVACAGGMAVAVLCAGWVAGAILLPEHRRAGMWACTALAMLYPVLLAAGSAPGAPVRAMQLLYVVTAAAGGIGALWTLPVTGSAPIRQIARV
jgi:hypothetical protein